MPPSFGLLFVPTRAAGASLLPAQKTCFCDIIGAQSVSVLLYTSEETPPSHAREAP